jgi:hypothetical protein
MLLPAVLGIAVAFLLARRDSGGEWRISGAWLILVALPVAVACDRLRGQVSDASVVNRGEAFVLCAVAAAFVYLNRKSSRTVVTSTWLVAVGVWLNALGVLVYGAMPVLQGAAAVADKPFTSSHPSPGYIRSDDLGAFGVVIGDFIPVPHFLKVLSIGDLFLFAGCIVLLGLFLARVWRSEPVVPPDLETEKEVAHG